MSARVCLGSGCPACVAFKSVRTVYVPVADGDADIKVYGLSARLWESLAELALAWPDMPELRPRRVDGVEFFDPVFS
jgi:hypothetical protein